jgi:hypothetical protein
MLEGARYTFSQQVLKDDNPGLVTVSKGYREPICLNVG